MLEVEVEPVVRVGCSSSGHEETSCRDLPGFLLRFNIHALRFAV